MLRRLKKQQRVIELIRSKGEAVSLSELLDEAGVTASVVRTLEQRGFVEVFAREVRRDPLAHIARHPGEAIKLNAEQQAAAIR